MKHKEKVETIINKETHVKLKSSRFLVYLLSVVNLWSNGKVNQLQMNL